MLAVDCQGTFPLAWDVLRHARLWLVNGEARSGYQTAARPPQQVSVLAALAPLAVSINASLATGAICRTCGPELTYSLTAVSLAKPLPRPAAEEDSVLFTPPSHHRPVGSDFDFVELGLRF